MIAVALKDIATRRVGASTMHPICWTFLNFTDCREVCYEGSVGSWFTDKHSQVPT